MQLTYDGDPCIERPESTLVRFGESEVTKHRPNDIGGTEHKTWYYTFEDAEWFPLAMLIALEPGESTSFISHAEATDGPKERTYRVVAGDVELRTEFSDERMGTFDVAYCPPGSAHQLRNIGTDTAWITSWACVGEEGSVEELLETRPENRPGYDREYDRIMAARDARGLHVPLGAASSNSSVSGERSEPIVQRFADTYPVRMPDSIETGASARPEWFMYFDSEWFNMVDLLKLEPGEQVSFHSHLPEHEGALEEVYWMFSDDAELRTEYWDTEVGRFDLMFFPPGAAHQIRNVGTSTVWFGALTSVGDESSEFDLDPSGGFAPEDRPGYVDEYARIMAARKERGLPVPAHLDME